MASLESHTLAASPMASDTSFSLFALPLLAGASGDLYFQERAEHGYQIAFAPLRDEASFYWFFPRPINLKNRWLRLSYSGTLVPSRILIAFLKGDERMDKEFDLYPENSLGLRQIYVKVPDDAAYASVDTVRLGFVPSLLENPAADFTIADLEILPEKTTPFTQDAREIPNFNGDNHTGTAPRPFSAL